MTLPKIKFRAKSKEEKAHLKKMKDLLSKKKHGDWKELAIILRTTNQNARIAFMRVYSVKHFDAVNGLEQIIEQRKQFLK